VNFNGYILGKISYKIEIWRHSTIDDKEQEHSRLIVFWCWNTLKVI
jgi:hypothetical protein